MKRITKNIKRGICLYLSENNMTHEQLATEIHATRQAVSQWLSGETKAINDRIWPRLEPLISKYINELALDNDGIKEYYKIVDEIFSIPEKKDREFVMEKLLKIRELARTLNTPVKK